MIRVTLIGGLSLIALLLPLEVAVDSYNLWGHSKALEGRKDQLTAELEQAHEEYARYIDEMSK